MGLKNGTVTLESNFTLWKKMFEDEKNTLIKIFTNPTISIEHVGSTAIKGLHAKPIVDIVVGINNFSDLDIYIEKLNKLYEIKNNKENNEILLIKEKDNETFFLIHILEKNSKRYKDMLKFRDILINNPNILKKYEDLKMNLAKIYSNDRKAYTKSKNDYIQYVLKKH